MFELRPYQQEAVQAVEKEWSSGVKSTLLVQATGCGKTITMAALARDAVDGGGRVLLLAHRGELLNQATDKFERAVGLSCSREQASSHTVYSLDPVTVGSVQSLMRQRRLDEFPRDYFSHVFIDEAHHSVADSYTRILDHFSDAKVLGVTATADRSDKKGLSKVFDTMAYEYGLRQAIEEGYLCPIKAQMIPINIDISAVRVHNGDFDANQLGNALEPYLDAISDEMRTYCSGRKTVVFLPLVKMAKDFAELLRSKGFRACEVDGGSPDREEVLKAFDDGEYDVLCNAMLLTEGWDCPDVDCIIVLRPTKSRGLFTQMVGRGTRLAPGKSELLLLDFLWMTERHNLCRPASLLGVEDDVREKMEERVAKGLPVDLLEAETQAKEDVVKAREDSLAEKLAEMRHRKKKLVDPLQYAMSIGDYDLQSYEPTFDWEKAEATEKQVRFLEGRGIDTGSMALSRGMASKLIDAVMRRQDEHLATPKQVRFLEQRGFLHCGKWTFDDASSMITQIRNNKWVVPHWITPATYVPKSLQA